MIGAWLIEIIELVVIEKDPALLENNRVKPL